ncbi:MAG TPA: RNA polymerase factor sigma-54 [Geobacteraceae bacterium]|nr:RNA polymerase factor sigma-54 [Geobacteraceae bacterium]
MAIEMRQQMKLTQQLVMTPQLQQAIKLLQLSRLELQDLVQQELEENPILEETVEQESLKEVEQVEIQEREPETLKEGDSFKEVTAGSDTIKEMDWDSYLDGYNYSSGEQYSDDEDRPSFENLLTKKGTLVDHLMWQLNLSKFEQEDIGIAVEIIGNIDEDGYLRTTVEDLARSSDSSYETVENVLKRVQDFDPPGVAARNLRECLLIQVQQLGMQGGVVDQILRDHLKDLETRRYKQISKALGISLQDILDAAKIISGLDPKPGHMFAHDDVQYISPDIFVFKVGDDYVVTLNDEGLPALRINPYYTDVKFKELDSGTEEYVSDKMRAAIWLIKSIHQRQRTIFKAAKSIVKFQREFFEKGIEYLRPLVLRDVAEDIGMHESTISRVTTNKYMHTPQGIFEMKYFFNSAISITGGDFIASESVKRKIKELIESEDQKKPLSDQTLAEMLAAGNINIARRTVTKYREMLRLGSSSERKRMF